MTAEQDRAVRHQVMVLLQGGQVETAQAVCEEHLRSRPRDHEAMAMLAQIHFRKGRFDEARRSLTKAIARGRLISRYLQRIEDEADSWASSTEETVVF